MSGSQTRGSRTRGSQPRGSAIARTRGLVGVAWAHVRADRLRTVLAVVTIAIAVLATTLLAGVGVGVLAVGEAQFDAAGQDLWLSGGAVSLTPAGGGGFENSIHGAHDLAADVRSHEDVQVAAPVGFQSVYVGTEPDDLSQLIATGVPAGVHILEVSEGRSFEGGDPHYADGEYDGPMVGEVIVDAQTAATYDLAVGDTLHVGGSLASAREHEFTVVGISPTFASFLGTPTVTLRLSELQTVTGTTGTDPATFVLVRIDSGADVEAVQAELQAAHPDYAVNSNREQLEAVLAQQALLLASAATLVVLALAAGLALTVNVLVLVVQQQRRELAALTAIGVSGRSIALVVAFHGLFLGVAGGVLGVALTPVGAMALNRAAGSLTGYDGLVAVPLEAFALGAAAAVAIGVASAAVAGWRIAQLSALEPL